MKYIDSADLGFLQTGNNEILFIAFDGTRTPKREEAEGVGEVWEYSLTIAEAKELHELLGELLEEIEPAKKKRTKK